MTEARQHWGNRFQFVFAAAGTAVGIGNVWRFPYLCYKNGGGAFFIPYLICMVCAGIPLFFLEVSLGQFMNRGGVKVWNICPMFRGIGISSIILVFFIDCYYIIVLTWAAVYFTHSFSSVLPWSTCGNDWNTENCSLANNSANYQINSTNLSSIIHPVDPSVEFWERKFLKVSSGIDEVGGIVWELAIGLLVVWILTYFSIWRGVKWTGKVVYFTTTFPYVILTIILVRGVTLDGAIDGIIYYLKPDFARLASPGVWIDAGTQIFFSYAVGMGALTTLGSYNKYNNNCYRQCIFISILNSGTSVYAGFAIFSVLGFMAKISGSDISEVAEKGPGLAFIVYPKAVSEMPVSQLWAALFFLMILILGLGTQIIGVEAIMTPLTDSFPNFFAKRGRRELTLLVYVILSFLIGLSMVTNGGVYILQIFDYYSASGFCLLWICFFEVVTIAWFYGSKRFYANIEGMIGYRPNRLLMICWKFLAPLCISGIFIFSAVKFQYLKYNKTYNYPPWAHAFGMCLALSSMVQIPLYIIYNLIKTRGSIKERWKAMLTPKIERNRNRDVQVNKEHDSMLENGKLELMDDITS